MSNEISGLQPEICELGLNKNNMWTSACLNRTRYLHYIYSHMHTHTLPKADKAEQCPLKATDHNINTILGYTVQCGQASLEDILSARYHPSSLVLYRSAKTYLETVH